jgi:DNA processing protein
VSTAALPDVGFRRLRLGETGYPAALAAIHDPPRAIFLRGGGEAAILGRPAVAIVVSEYEPGVEPAPWRFPARNRVIAGLAEVTVIVEARERSGALITADFALEDGRTVFAVPGEITGALSAGTNRLLRDGAAPLVSTSDVLDVFGFAATPPQRERTLSREAEAMLERLRERPWAVDELARAAGRTPAAVSASLTELELAGAATASDGLYRAVMPSV